MDERLRDQRQCIASSGVVRRAFWATEGCSDIVNFAYTEDPDVVILNGPATPMVGKYNCATHTYLWRTRIKFHSSVAYHPRSRRVLGYAHPQKALVELDADTGELVRELKATELGPIGQCQNVRYATSYDFRNAFKVYNTHIDDDPDLIFIADGENHVAGMLHMSTGKFVWRFGEYGKPGSDLTHLNAPRDVVWTFPGGAWIADHLNHRLLNVENVLTEPRVKNQWIFPRPTSVGFAYSTPASGFFAAVAAVAAEFRYQPLTLVLAEFDEVCLETATCLLGWAPIACNQASFNPWNPRLLQVNQWNSAFEIDWMETPTAWKHMARFAKPYCIRQPIPADGHWSSEPVVGLINDRILAKVFATTDCRAVIEVPTPALRLLATPAEFQWVPVAEFPVARGKMALHAQHEPLAVCRITVLADKADAEVTVHVEGY